MRYLVDTNVFSELRRGPRCAPAVARWSASVQLNELLVSVVTLLEIEKGIRLAERRDVEQGARMRSWFEQSVLTGFHDRILAIDAAVARRAAALHVPDPAPELDALIAATALVHDLTVVTRNVTDFTRTGVRLLDPWRTP